MIIHLKSDSINSTVLYQKNSWFTFCPIDAMAGSAKIRNGYDHSRQRPVTTCNANDVDDSAVDLTDLSQLKEVSERLNLATRRPSTVQWQQV